MGWTCRPAVRVVVRVASALPHCFAGCRWWLGVATEPDLGRPCADVWSAGSEIWLIAAARRSSQSEKVVSVGVISTVTRSVSQCSPHWRRRLGGNFCTKSFRKCGLEKCPVSFRSFMVATIFLTMFAKSTKGSRCPSPIAGSCERLYDRV